MIRPRNFIGALAAFILPSAFQYCSLAADASPTTQWIDVYSGEPATYDEVLDDLAKSRVVYLGERHTIERQHETQARIVADLAKRGVSLALAMEQLETFRQPTIDRYNRGEVDFDQLAKAVDWAKSWPNYAQYRPIVEAAHRAGAPLIAISPEPKIIHRIAIGGGVAKLDPEMRKALPVEMQLADPLYEKLLSLELMVHMAASPERLRPMIEAQIARDEAMAAALAGFLQSDAGKGRTAIVICGSGHVAYGLGTVARVRRRIPTVRDRVLVLAAGPDLELSAEDKAASRPVEITHEQMRPIDRPVADYLEVPIPQAHPPRSKSG